MDYTLLNQYGIIALVVIFICINIYYKNIINVLIFIICFLGLRNMMNEQNALFLAYILALVYGIIKNFHLLENFKIYMGKPNNSNTTSNTSNTNSNKETNNTSNTNSNKETNTTSNITSNKETNTSNNTSNSKKENKQNYNIDSALSEELINQFISKLKEVDNLLIEKKDKNIYDLKPTIKTMKKTKINKLKKTMTDDEINTCRKDLE